MANPIMVKAWFKKAIEGYHSAKALCDLRTSGHILNGAYLAQQSIEKSMKGFLTFKNVRFSKTHHLEELLNLLKGMDGVPGYIFSERELLIHLSDWAISGRYPDAVVKTPTPPKHEDIQPALEFALNRTWWIARGNLVFLRKLFLSFMIYANRWLVGGTRMPFFRLFSHS